MSEQITYTQELLRKLIHLSSLWMVISLGLFSRSFNVFLFAILLIVSILVEYGNFKRWPFFVATYGRLFGKMLREKEKNEHFHISGAPYVIAAALMVAILFERSIAMTALATMLIGDSFAALIGRKFGRHKINENTKSMEGSLAFWISAATVLLFFFFFFRKTLIFLIMGIIGITIAMFAEIYEKQIKIDDNFSIPLAMGIALSLTRFF